MNRTWDDLKCNGEMVRIFQCSILNKYFTLYIYIYIYIYIQGLGKEEDLPSFIDGRNS